MKIKIHNLIIKTIAINILIFSSYSCIAQIFDSEQNAPSVKWKQINTENFQLIYAQEMENEAQRLSNTLMHMIDKVGLSYSKKPRKISIILQSADLFSNGFVQLAPRRSEFISTPPQSNDYQDWLDGLAIHEWRHVVQFDNMASYARAPLLQQLGLAFFGIILPPWFYEGDAVLHETLLSHAGRGRLPSWEMTYRTNTLSNKKYSYQKDIFGSFKDITPNYYVSGYFMTTKLARDFGNGSIEGILEHAASNPFRPYNISRSIKKLTGKTTDSWHSATRQELDSLWRLQDDASTTLPYSHLPQNSGTDVENYLLPQTSKSGSIFALLTSYHSVPSIVSIDTLGEVTPLTKVGPQTDAHYSLGEHLLAWHEVRYDKRFHKRNYQVIMTYDLTEKRHKQLTSKSRLFSPAVSGDDAYIAAIEVAEDNKNALIVLNSNNGKETARIEAPQGVVLATPSFHPTGKKIIALARSKEGTNLIEFDLKADSSYFLLPWQRQEIERPRYAPWGIVFKAHYSGIQNIYLLKAPMGQPLQVTFSSFGASNPFYDAEKDRLLFNDYQAKGHLISQVKRVELFEKAAVAKHDLFIDYSRPLRPKNAGTTALDSVPDQVFQSRSYSDWKHLFNFHSVSPVGDDFSDIGDIKPGLQLLSDNLLNTLQTRIGFEYDPNISRSNYFVHLSFQRYYPKINLEYQNRAILTSALTSNRERIPLRWRENQWTLSTTIPLRFNRLNTVYNMAWVAGIAYLERYGYSLRVNDSNTKQYPLVFQYYINRNSRQSLRDIAPKWGQNINLVHRTLILHPNQSGSYLSARSTFYFPGIVNNHSLQLRFNYQYGDGGFSNRNEIPMVSGYDQLQATHVTNTLLANYRFPLFYPDWAIGNLAYIKRFRAGFFSDFENFGRNNNYRPRTFGLELRSDMNLLRFYLPNFDLACRMIYVNESSARPVVFTYGLSYTY
ncbi:hypothetical protein [Olivibacter sitiensis]|uniref:hypothetical protein n=1 Tax=Olivibacter sitiensis TaxID=376470 RepID=UPI00041AB465|nr:hypothetical protein [Olivibacter sitiensis]